jgi:heme A synthase
VKNPLVVKVWRVTQINHPRPFMIDLLIALGIGASFVVFAVCLWLIQREKTKKKNPAPPKLPKV